MNILVMRPRVEQGGVQRFIELLGAGLVARGHAVTVVTNEEQISGRLAECGMVVRHCPLYPSSVGNLVRSTNLLVRLVRDEQFDILLSTHRFTTIVGKFVSHITHAPLIATLHERSRNLDRFAGLWTGQTTVVPSDALKDDLVARLHLEPNRIRVIPNGIPPSNPVQPEKIAMLRASLRLRSDCPVVGYVGRLSPEKGVLILIESVGLLRDRGVFFQTLIVGDGVDGAMLKQRVQQMKLDDRITFVGSRTDAPELMAVMDIVALPSLHESFGLVILEAMSASRPVIGTRVGGIPELIQEGITGLLVPPQSPQTLADAINRLLANPELCQKMGDAGRRYAKTEYSADVMVERYLDLFRCTNLLLQ